MAYDSVLQVRMDSKEKNDVEKLYEDLGTSFADAVRIFARQSLIAGGFPFRPSLKTWDQMTQDEINAKISAALADIDAGNTFSQSDLDLYMEKLIDGSDTKI